jgi:hypothetical protein
LRFVAVKKISRSKGLSATGFARSAVRDGFKRRMRQLCGVRPGELSMRCSRSVVKFECSEALALDQRFAHGSNINARGASCGKLVASAFCAKCLAAKSGQGSVVAFAGAIFNQSEHRAFSRFRDLPAAAQLSPLIVRNFAVRFEKRGFADGPEPYPIDPAAGEAASGNARARQTRRRDRGAQRTIDGTQVLRLALADQQALADALCTPPKPKPALRRARAAHRRLIAATR